MEMENATPIVSNIDVFAVLSERSTRHVFRSKTFVEETFGDQPRRRERRLRIGDNDEIIINLEPLGIKLTPWMVRCRTKIKDAREKAVGVFEQLLKRREPDITKLKELRRLVLYAEYLTQIFNRLEYRAKKNSKRKRKLQLEKINQHQEKQTATFVYHFKSSFSNEQIESEKIAAEFKEFAKFLNDERIRTRVQSEARKQSRYQERQDKVAKWRYLRITREIPSIREEAEEAYVDGNLPSTKFLELNQLLEQLPETVDPAETVSDAYAEGLLSRPQYQILKAACR